nr:retrotransposon protein, putative, unclassified [Tanacetum cinerariifolium]
MKEKWDLCILVGYSTQSKGYHVYNKRKRIIVESIKIKEVFETSIANDTLCLVPQRQKASDYDNLDLVPQRQDVSSSADKKITYQMMNLPILFVHRHKKLLSLPHTTLAKYALEILHKHGMENGQSIGTPMATKPKLDADLSGNPIDQTDYRSKIRSLMYLTSSRPDIVQANCTTMSSAEAEYVALFASCAQVIWMRTQIQDYGFNYNKISLYCNSQSAIAISCNPVHHSHTKHIHTRYHFIKKQVKNDIIELYFFRTEYQLADMFTKDLPEDRFKYLVRRIGMTNYRYWLQITSSRWSFVSAILGQMTYLVADLTPDCKSISTVFSWSSSIGSECFWPSILLLAKIIRVIVTDILVVVAVGQKHSTQSRVPVANATLFSLAQLLRENTDSVLPNQQMSPTTLSVPLK